MAQPKNNRIISLMDDLSKWKGGVTKLADKIEGIVAELDKLSDSAASIIGSSATLPNSKAKAYVSEKFNSIINQRINRASKYLEMLSATMDDLENSSDVDQVMDFLGNMPIKSAFGNEDSTESMPPEDELLSTDNTNIRNESYDLFSAENGKTYAYKKRR
jgi:hypothetical protein